METEPFLYPWRTRLILAYVRASMLFRFHSLISTQIFRRALTASVDSCQDIYIYMYIKQYISNNIYQTIYIYIIWQSLEEDAGKRGTECVDSRVIPSHHWSGSEAAEPERRS